MRRKIPEYLFLIIVPIWSVLVHGAALSWDEPVIEFGEAYQFTQVRRDIQIWNHSEADVALSAPVATSRGAEVRFDKTIVRPGESTTARLKLAPEDRAGKAVFRIPFDVTEGDKPAHYEIRARGFVESIFDEPRPGIDFGVVDKKAAAVEKSVRLTSIDAPDFRIGDVLDVPDFLTVRVGADRQELLIKPKKVDRLGYNKGSIRVAINSKLQHEAAVSVVMDIHGDVVPDQNPLSFDLQRPGTVIPVRLQLTSRSGKPFRVGKVKLEEADHVSAAAAPCLPTARPDCAAYLLTLKKDHPFGQVLGTVGFELPDSKEILNVSLAGVFIADNMVVQSLNKSPEQAAAEQQTRALVPDLTQEIKHAVEPRKDSAPAGSGPLLKWQVANEGGIYGYVIYRSDKQDGRFSRINDSILRADNSGDNTTSGYQWRDTNAEVGKEYWYYITMLYADGRKVRLTDPQKVVAK